MRLRRLQLDGITRFRSAVEVDFDAAGPGVLALVGCNGAGKTTLLEASGPGALFRELPTRPDPPLQNHVGPKGGFLELRFASGDHEYACTLKYPAKGSPQAFLHVDGVAVTSGKLKDYDAAIAERFGRPEAFYASVFAAQGGKGRFAELSVADRKAVFRFYLGLGRVEAVHAAAKARLAAVDLSRAERLARELGELRVRLPVFAEQVRLREAEVEEVALTRDAASAALRALEADSALSAAIAAYRRALREVVVAEAARDSLKAREPAPVPGVPPDPERAYAELEEARERASEVRSLEADLAEARSLFDEASRVLDDAQMRAEEVHAVPCGGEGPFAACKFLHEALAAAEALPSYEAVQAEAEELVQIREAAAVEAEPALNVAALDAAWKAARRARQDYDDAVRGAEKLASSLVSAEAELKAARRRAIALRRELPDPLPDVPTPEDVASARRALGAAQAALDDAVRRHVACVAEETAAKGRIDLLDEDLVRESAAAGDGPALQLLVRGFGPGGIQALEIDASGPRVSDLANELASACYGDRFQLAVRTQRELKSRDGSAEDFDVEVLDAARGRTGKLAGFSGGEQVVLEEALRTSLALFAIGSRAGVEFSTLWKDECSGQLDGHNKVAYARMLHRARAMGGFHHVLVVTHDEEVAAAADARICVGEDGSVRVER